MYLKKNLTLLNLNVFTARSPSYVCVCKLLVTLASGISKWTAQRQISLRSEEDISLHFKSDIVHLFQNLELHLWREQPYLSKLGFLPYISQLVRSPHTLMTWVIVSGLFWIITVKANACWLRLTQAESNYSRSRKHIWQSHQYFFQCFLSFHWQRVNSVFGLQKKLWIQPSQHY